MVDYEYEREDSIYIEVAHLISEPLSVEEIAYREVGEHEPYYFQR